MCVLLSVIRRRILFVYGCLFVLVFAILISIYFNKLSSLDDGMAEALTPFYTKGRPNTYTFTKSVAEYLVATQGLLSSMLP